MPEVVDVGIAGVFVVPLTAHPDSRGSFTEVFRQEWLPAGAPMMLQANLSLSRAGVLRGLHFHRRQADYWCVFAGKAFVGLYDLRRGSPTEGKKAEIRLDEEEGRRGLYIPKGVAHGFYAETDVQLQYLVDQYFTGGDEFGVAWDDPDVGIDWPGRAPILSDRDQSNPSLPDALGDPPPYEP
jgi:dTDP-4-dehydrorhamnose 3,5-epimerase